MQAITRVIRNTPVDSLQTYFEQKKLPHGITWHTSKSVTAHRLLNAAKNHWNDDLFSEVSIDFERVNTVADELGDFAVQGMIKNASVLSSLENEYHRALWLFLHDQHAFRRAEQIRYTDQSRQGQRWSGFIGPKKQTVSKNPEHLAQFEAHIRSIFRCEEVKLELYDRIRNLTDQPEELIQLVVYRDGLPNSYMELKNGNLLSKKRRPVFELVITYAPNTGTIEVIAQKRALHPRLARLFASILLQYNIMGLRVSLRQYDLSPLLKQSRFPTDPEDGIAWVRVKSVRLCYEQEKVGYINLYSPSHDEKNLHERSIQWFPNDIKRLLDLFIIERAEIQVRFRPDRASPRGKTITVALSLPNGCSLKGKTKKERLICEKYLARWNLVKDM
ncbi:hypothetical protein ACQZV8_13425 [Magnetococcales bacterium HHB-1]